jgi:hypothetical protein
VTITWADLNREQWTWAMSARAELRTQLTGLADPDNIASMAHVMLVGDTQAGKTTVLLWLLGVSDEHAERAAQVLRAGRDYGRSATATPVRYCWSGDPDKWLLIQGREQQNRTRCWVTDQELAERLIAYRSPRGDQLRWCMGDPPLEIGIPDGMAGGAPRPPVRILDMPGLKAESGQEDQVARQLVSRAVPSMSVIVIVQPAQKMADTMQDDTITRNPHLACWHSDPARFRIVFTRAFEADSTLKLLTEEFGAAGGDPRAVAGRLRAHVTAQLIQSTGITADREALEKIVFPVDVGQSRRKMADGQAAIFLPANDLLLAELRATLEDPASEDGRYLSAPSLERHVESLVRHRGDLRRQRLDRLTRRHAQAQAQVIEAESALEKRRGRLELAARETAGIRDDAATLAAVQPTVRRPRKPDMKGPAVRESQENDRSALLDAATELWGAWRVPGVSRQFPATLPAEFERQLRAQYDLLAGCCGACSTVPPARWRYGRPDHCYAKMTAAVDQMRSWITAKLLEHVQPTVSAAQKQLGNARTQCDRAERQLAIAQQELSAAAAARDRAQQEAEREEQDDERELRIARQVLDVHDRHNERYIRELARRAETATPAECGYLAVAALRAVYDLDRMHGRV